LTLNAGSLIISSCFRGIFLKNSWKISYDVYACILLVLKYRPPFLCHLFIAWWMKFIIYERSFLGCLILQPTQVLFVWLMCLTIYFKLPPVDLVICISSTFIKIHSCNKIFIVIFQRVNHLLAMKMFLKCSATLNQWWSSSSNPLL